MGLLVSQDAHLLPKLSKFPQLVAEFDKTKNYGLDPEGLNSSSVQKVWWKCPVAEDHVWQTSISARTKKMVQAAPAVMEKKPPQLTTSGTYVPI